VVFAAKNIFPQREDIKIIVRMLMNLVNLSFYLSLKLILFILENKKVGIGIDDCNLLFNFILLWGSI
jgi:hypothetical protein